MFPLIGVAEIVTVIVDAAVVALILVRWQFVWTRTFGAWLAMTTAMVAVFITLLIDVVGTSGWTSNVVLVICVGSLATLLLVRLVALRLMSKSLAFRRELKRPLKWGWVIAIPIAGIVLALVVGGLAEGMSGGL